MDSTEGAQVGTERHAGSFTGITVHFTLAIPISIPCPLPHAMACSGLGRMAAPIALPLVGIEHRAASWDICRNQFSAGARVRMVADRKPVLARVPRHDTDDGRAIIGIGLVPYMSRQALQSNPARP